MAHLWASIAGVTAVKRVRSRGESVYIAAFPAPLRIDWKNETYQELGKPSETGLMAQDILAPLGGNRLVTVFASPQSASIAVLVSIDDGLTWAAGAPLAPSTGSQSALTSTLVGYADSSSKPGRTFLTVGGATLDFSDDGGRTWSRAVVSGSSRAQGLALDSAGTTLWLVTEGAIDRVAAFSMPVGTAGALPPEWNGQLIEGWDANGVYSAEKDPFDPHGIYIGGEGRLGYLHPTADGGSSTGIKWNASQDGGLYTYVMSVLPSDALEGSIIFGGGEQGGGPARVVEIATLGSPPTDVLFEGAPTGTVRGIVRAESRLLLFVETGSSLDIYTIAR